MVEVTQGKEGTFLSQTKYITDVVQDAGLENYNPASSPFDISNKLATQSEPLDDPEKYRRWEGCCISISQDLIFHTAHNN